MANNIAVLASTNATDMQAVIDAINAKKLNAKIKILIANKDCGAVERAKNNKIPFKIIPSKDYKDRREDFDREVAKAIDDNECQLVLMIGYMRLVTPWFIKKYENRIINIHPSLLPAFAGGMDKNVHEEVLKYGCKITGCTLHFATEEADLGPIIAQKAVDISEDETVDSLKTKVQKAEQDIIVKGIKLFFDKKLKIEGRKVKILG